MKYKFIKIKDKIINTKNIKCICKDKFLNRYLIEVKLHNEDSIYINFGEYMQDRDKEFVEVCKKLGVE